MNHILVALHWNMLMSSNYEHLSDGPSQNHVQDAPSNDALHFFEQLICLLEPPAVRMAPGCQERKLWIRVGFLTPTAFHVLVNIHSNQIYLNRIIAGKWLTFSG